MKTGGQTMSKEKSNIKIIVKYLIKYCNSLDDAKIITEIILLLMNNK